MLRRHTRCLSTALKDISWDYYDYVVKIPNNIKLPPKPKLPEDLKNERLLVENSGNICNECFGSGLVSNNDLSFNLNSNFKLEICKKCNGTGFI